MTLPPRAYLLSQLRRENEYISAAAGIPAPDVNEYVSSAAGRATYTKQKAEPDDPIRLFYEGGVTGPKTGDMKKFKAFVSSLVQFEYTIDL
uniref:hypothetical protein n=1 Tax=Eubacterium cellulosolvens TaxID=29322 RepID=UPI0004801E50|nr:hypothetical protein [[Eubacterium] cellulosolvens]